MARITLTFDNGPDPIGTPWVLDVLARRGLRATFFVLGRHLEAPGGLSLARDIRDAGHRLANHTFTHEIPLGLDPRPDAVQLELEQTHQRLAQVWDGPWLFRPFGGGGRLGPHLLSEDAVRWLCKRSYSCILWNSVPGDYEDPNAWVERALADANAHDEVLMVLHDAYPEGMRKLEAFLDAALDRGHTFVDTFPVECVVIVEGETRVDLAPYMGQPNS